MFSFGFGGPQQPGMQQPGMQQQMPGMQMNMPGMSVQMPGMQVGMGMPGMQPMGMQMGAPAPAPVAPPTTPIQVQWNKLPGRLTKMACGGKNHVYGVQENGTIWRLQPNNQWQQVFGAATEIACGSDGALWVIHNSNIFRWTGGENWTANGWVQAPGSAVKVVCGNAQNVVVINSKNELYKWTGTTWTLMPGSGHNSSIAADGTHWVHGGDRNVYRWDPATPAGGNGWKVIAGSPAWNLTEFSIAAGHLIVGIRQNKLFKYHASHNVWQPIESADVKDVAVGIDGTLVVCQNDGDIFLAQLPVEQPQVQMSVGMPGMNVQMGGMPGMNVQMGGMPGMSVQMGGMPGMQGQMPGMSVQMQGGMVPPPHQHQQMGMGMGMQQQQPMMGGFGGQPQMGFGGQPQMGGFGGQMEGAHKRMTFGEVQSLVQMCQREHNTCVCKSEIDNYQNRAWSCDEIAQVIRCISNTAMQSSIVDDICDHGAVIDPHNVETICSCISNGAVNMGVRSNVRRAANN